MSPNDPNRPDPAGLLRGAHDQARAEEALPQGLPTLLELQQHFPEFEIRGLVGRGGMGAVYRAHDPKLDREVAIKVLPAQLAADPRFTERFRREARALARLQHPHILTVHDFGERDGLHYVLTEFVDGVDLRRLLSMGQLPPEEALRIVPQICSALQHAHDHGVVHRDVKPENVLVDTAGHVRVADFGLAKLIDPKGDDAVSLTAMSQVVGTPHYMAPEQLHGRPVDHRADIFALGVMLYEMLTGQLPVGHFAPPSRQAGTEPRLDQIVLRALESDPERRYQKVSEVEQELQAAPPPRGHRRRQHRHAGPAVARPAPDTPPSRLVRGPIIALSIVGILLIALVGLRVASVNQAADDATHAMEWSRYQARLHQHESLMAAGRVSADDAPRPPVIPGDRRSIEAWDKYHRQALERWQALYDAGYTTAADRPERPVIPAITSLRDLDAAWALAWLAPLFVMLIVPFTGFRAMARIRRAGGALHGVGIAVVCAWLPLLLGAWALLTTALDRALRDHDTTVIAQFVLAGLFLLIGPALMALQAQRLRRDAGLEHRP